MRIILFENNPHLRKKICSLVESTFHRSIDVMTDQWHELSESYREETTLYFLDIMVRDEAQGIAFAQWILKKSDKHLIVFLTNYIDKILGQTYLQVNSFNVIYKGSPHVMEQIIDSIELAQSYVNRQTLVIENRIENYILPFDDIYSIQAIKKSNKVVIHTQRENQTCIASLKEIFSQLDKRFVYATRSSIINREKILKIDKVNKHFILADGSICDFTLSFALKGGLYDASLLD